jgi:hypothetical protein
MQEGNDLKAIAQEVWDDLDKIFRFGEKSRMYIGTVSEDDESIHITLYGAEDVPGAELNTLADRHFSGNVSGNHIYLQNGRPAEYVLFVSGISDETPVIMGEGITNCEHKKTYANLSGSLDNYARDFHGSSETFVSMLGSLYISRLHGFELMPLPLDVGEPQFEAVKDSRKIGCAIAKQLHDSGMPRYQEIFHAPNQGAMWDMVRNVISPKLDMFVPKGVDKDPYYKRMKAAMEDARLKGEINIIERLP